MRPPFTCGPTLEGEVCRSHSEVANWDDWSQFRDAGGGLVAMSSCFGPQEETCPFAGGPPLVSELWRTETSRFLKKPKQGLVFLSSFSCWAWWGPLVLLFVAQTENNLPEMQEICVWPLDREDLLEKGMTTHSSNLAYRIPWTEGPGGLQSMQSQRVWHDWATKHSTQKANMKIKYIKENKSNDFKFWMAPFGLPRFWY